MSAVQIVDTYYHGALSFKLLKTTSDCAQHPTVILKAPPGTVILGGAYVDWDGACSPPSPPGNLLTAMYPNNNGTTWTVASKDHLEVSKARVVAYCIAAQMKDGTPISLDDYKIDSATNVVAAHLTQQVNLPAGFTVVGGGARANYGGLGNMLFASYPTVGWDLPKTSFNRTITVWAIGLRECLLRNAGMFVSSFDSTSSPDANHPWHTFVIPDFHLTGAGARVNWNGAGNLLTASLPEDRQTVVAHGKDHIEVDRSTITAYAVGFMG